MSNLFSLNIQGLKFNFQPFNAGNTNGYHVDVTGKDGARQEFRIEHSENDHVKFEGENLPEWLKEMEDAIKSALDKQD